MEEVKRPKGYQPRKKLNLRVKRDLQFWILKRALVSTLIGILTGLLILYFFSHRELGESFYSAHLTIKRVSDLLLPVIVIGGLAGFLASLILMIFFPQKIAGPIYRLERDLCRHLKEGDLTFVYRVRKTDPFQSLSEALNEGLSSLRERVAFMAEKAKRARSALEKGQTEEALKHLKELEKFMEEGLRY